MKTIWNIALKIAPCIVLAVLLCCLSVAESKAANNSTQTILEGAKIDPRYSAASSAVVGRFEQLSGKVAVLRDQGKTGYWARKEDPVHVSDTVVSLDGAARIKFRSHDVAILAANSTLQVERFVEGATAGKKDISLRSSIGNTMFYVFGLFGYRDVDFTVQTPSKVASVRGTKFGLAVRNDDEEAGSWLFRETTRDPREHNVRTDCFCEDGRVEIAGFFLGPDDLYREERGEVIPLSSAEGSEFLQTYLPTFGNVVGPTDPGQVEPTDPGQRKPENLRDRDLLRSETEVREEIEDRRQVDEFPAMVDDDDD
ncbi:MAG: FecR domain-containing protein [Desulfobulbus sp.]